MVGVNRHVWEADVLAEKICRHCRLGVVGRVWATKFSVGATNQLGRSDLLNELVSILL